MGDVEVIRLIEAAPMRTVRTDDIGALLPNPSRVLTRLVRIGAVTKLAHGFYTVPPGGADGREWRPPVEVGALAVATARFGQRRAILIGDGAARHWHAIPRAIGSATIAVEERGVKPVELATGGRIRFVVRHLEDVDAVLERTVLGEALVATLPQTLYDLATGDDHPERAEAIADLVHRVTRTEFDTLLGAKRRVPAAARETLRQLAD